jgi:hypothetical protein
MQTGGGADEPLHLDKWSLVQRKIMGIPTRIILIIILFDETFKVGHRAIGLFNKLISGV